VCDRREKTLKKYEAKEGYFPLTIGKNQKQMTFNKNHSPVCMPLLLQRNGTAVSSSIILSLQAANWNSGCI